MLYTFWLLYVTDKSPYLLFSDSIVNNLSKGNLISSAGAIGKILVSPTPSLNSPHLRLWFLCLFKKKFKLLKLDGALGNNALSQALLFRSGQQDSGGSREVWIGSSCWFAVIRHHRLGALNNGNFFLTVLEAESPRSRWRPAGLLFSEPLSLACRRLPSCCLLTWPFLCVCPSLV